MHFTINAQCQSLITSYQIQEGRVDFEHLSVIFHKKPNNDLVSVSKSTVTKDGVKQNDEGSISGNDRLNICLFCFISGYAAWTAGMKAINDYVQQCLWLLRRNLILFQIIWIVAL